MRSTVIAYLMSQELFFSQYLLDILIRVTTSEMSLKRALK